MECFIRSLGVCSLLHINFNMRAKRTGVPTDRLHLSFLGRPVDKSGRICETEDLLLSLGYDPRSDRFQTIWSGMNTESFRLREIAIVLKDP